MMGAPFFVHVVAVPAEHMPTDFDTQGRQLVSLLFRNRRVARAKARELINGWLEEFPGKKQQGSWKRGWIVVGPRRLDISGVRGEIARRIWEAEERRLAILKEAP